MEDESISIRLNFRSKQPLAEQIADSLRQKILSGAILPEDPLPPVRQLASRLKVNFNTVARAYRMLDFEGYCSTQRGRGTFIVDWRAGQDQAAEPVPLSQLLARRAADQAQDAGVPVEAVIEALQSLLEKSPLQSIPTKVHPKLRAVRALRRVRNVLHPEPLVGKMRRKPGQKKPRYIKRAA